MVLRRLYEVHHKMFNEVPYDPRRSKTPTGVGLVLLDIGPPSGYTLTIPKHWRFGRYSMRVHHQEKFGDRYHFYLEKVS